MAVMRFDMFADKIKDSVTCKQLLELNGIRVSRHGFAVCPLHGDHDASLKVYGGDRGWVCYGCHKGGDVINLARGLYGIGFNDAIRRLNDEFSVGLDLDGKVSQKDSFLWKAKQIRDKYARMEEEKAKSRTEDAYLDWLSIYRIADAMVVDAEPTHDEDLTEVFYELIKLRDIAQRRTEETYWEWVAYG